MWTKIVITSLFVISVLLSAQVAYTVTDLGPLSPTAINTWGQVVGNYKNQAYIRTFGRTRDLGLLPGGKFSHAAAINDLGVVTGTADGRGTVISPYLSFIRINNVVISLSRSFGHRRRVCRAWAPSESLIFSNMGQVVITRSTAEASTILLKSWETSQLLATCTHTRSFGQVPQGSPSSVVVTHPFGNGVSNSGEIVGQNSDGGNNLGVGHATSWKDGVPTDLGTLGGGAGVVDYGSSANGVNDLGLVVGWSTIGPISCCAGSSPIHAVLWTLSTGITDLGTLSGDTSSVASKINLFGQVIGSSGNMVYTWNEFPSSPFEVIGRPFVWTQRLGVRDLNTLIPANSGWVLTSATDINVWGQIVGFGLLDGQPRGFLLTPKVFW